MYIEHEEVKKRKWVNYFIFLASFIEPASILNLF
jgi:hypothetical protein